MYGVISLSGVSQEVFVQLTLDEPVVGLRHAQVLISEQTRLTPLIYAALPVTFGDMEVSKSDARRVRHLELANDLAASVDSARRQPLLEKPLLTWCEGDAIVQLLNVLADVFRGEPLAELSAELSEKLHARLGSPPGYDVNAVLRAIADDKRS